MVKNNYQSITLGVWWSALPPLTKLKVVNKFEDASLKYFNVKSKLGASEDASPESMGI